MIYAIIFYARVVLQFMSGEKRYENRSRPIRPGYYGVYAGKRKLGDSFETIRIEQKIVGVIHVHDYWKQGDPDYPIDPHATGLYTHKITFYPLPETEYISGMYKRGQVTYMKITDPSAEKSLLALTN